MNVSRRRFLAGTAVASATMAFPFITRAAKTTTFRIGHVMPTTHPYHLGCVKFSELVEQGTGGAVKVQVYPSSQIGGEVEIIRGMGLGTIDGGAAASGSIPPATGVGRFHLLDMPYIIKDYETAEQFATGPLGEKFRADMPERAGFHILGYGAAGFHQVLNSVRPVRTPEDISGLKLRIWQAPGAQLALKLMGANPTPMAFAEVFSALQQGVVDGLTNSATTFYQSKLYEVAPYLSMTQHAYVWVPLMLSNRAIQSVGKAEQKVIASAGQEAARYWRALLPASDEEALNNMNKAGIQITQADKGAFRAKVEKGYDHYMNLADENGIRELIAQLRNLSGKA